MSVVLGLKQLHLKSSVSLTDPLDVVFLVTLGLVLVGEPGLFVVFEAYVIQGLSGCSLVDDGCCGCCWGKESYI